jgi:hypothetical protein
MRSLILCVFLAAASPSESAAQPTCAYDRDALLALDYETFDQDPQRGWRAVERSGACQATAADLIAIYRQHHMQELPADSASNLRWHEGQLRAFAGQTDAAVSIFGTTYRGRRDGWDAYVDATVAFLRHDRIGLLASRHRLSLTPKPPNWDEVAADFQRRTGHRIRWPNNLDVVDGLIRCFDKSYREAYSSDACRGPE